MLSVLLDTTLYRSMALLHILSAVVAFGPVFLYPGLRRNGETGTIATMHMRMTFPALVALWVLGMGLAGISKPEGASDPVYTMSQTWLAASIVNWVMLVAVSWFLIRPSISDRSDAAESKLAAGVGITHVGLIIGLALMIWKPGF